MKFARNIRSTKTGRRELAVAIVIFLIALLPRVLTLGTTLTADEPLWLERSANFIDAILGSDWTSTFQSGHPGVTTMWLSGTALRLFHSEGMDFAEKLAIAQFPIALITSIGVVVLLYLVKGIYNYKVAIYSALFVSLNPFYLAHSRVTQLDALVTTFMVLSVLSVLAYLNAPEKQHYLALTGFLAGLAFLTKLPSVYLSLLLPFSIVTWHLLSKPKGKFGNKIPTIIKSILLVAFFSFITYFAVWPSMWVDPALTIAKLFNTAKVATVIPAGSGYFLGEVSKGTYGASFYPVVLFMRSTPVTMGLLLCCLIYLTKDITTSRITNTNKNTLILFLYVALFLIQMSIGSKKADRYLLPVFPAVDILAALGLYYLTQTVAEKLPLISDKFKKLRPTTVKYGLVCLMFIAVLSSQAYYSLPLHPYYMAYFNPILGNSSRANEILVVGWGEGMDLAARYLNAKPNAKNLTVAALYYGFEPYFVGKTIGRGKDIGVDEFADADYIVFYTSYIQRGLNKDQWAKFKTATPEKTIVLNNIDYAYIYKNNSIFWNDL